MPSVERELSQERDVVKHKHSFSETIRPYIPPMWDSSDPDRAPPPLPLNPGSPNLTTRPNTSATIAAAARALEEKARESSPASAYVVNPMPQKSISPDRSLIKGAQHKRMQSFQNASVRELRSYLDGTRTPDRSPERSPERVGRTTTPHFTSVFEKDYFPTSPEKSPTRMTTPTPASHDFLKDAPALRPTSRPPPKAILGENTPPSATMLALQTMPIRDFEPSAVPAPLSNIKNSPSSKSTQNSDGIASKNYQNLDTFSSKNYQDLDIFSSKNHQNTDAFLSKSHQNTDTFSSKNHQNTDAFLSKSHQNIDVFASKTPQNLDAFTTQLQSITTIATGLQREMAQLSRRSKDNATDLISLKEATNARDEDIRKMLKDLVKTISSSQALPPFLGASPTFNRSTGGLGSSNAEPKDPHTTPPTTNRTFTYPRVPSPANFFVDERIGSPNPYSVEGAASVAMLEKIIREMVTKEGQERLLGTLSKLLDKASQESGETAKKVTELVDFIKEGGQSQALIARGGGIGGAPPQQERPVSEPSGSGPLTRTSRELNGMFMMHGDGEGARPYSSPKAADFVSAEMLKLLKKIKDSVTESGGLTAEVKALVRDLRSEVLGMGRELGRKIDEHDKIRGNHLAIEDGSGKQDIGRIIQEGLVELKTHMDRVIHDSRRRSNSSTISRATVDSQEVYNVVKHTISEKGLERHMANPSGLDKEDILSAVREAYEAYKPEIELQQFGLERDEILQCLKEGLEDYQSSKSESTGISKEEVMGAIQEAVQEFNMPKPITEAHEIRDEVLCAVRECLDDFKPGTQLARIDDISSNDATRDLVLEAVKEGLAIHGPGGPREIEISRDDLLDAVRTALEGSNIGGYNEEVVSGLHDLVERMRDEFKSYSTANGRDTDQVLDAIKDGLESLRSEIESYVDKTQDVTGKDEIIETIKLQLENIKSASESGEASSDGTSVSKSELLGYLKSEFEHLHETLNSQLVPQSNDKEELLGALNDGFQNLKSQALTTRSLDEDVNDEMNEALKEEFEQIKEAIISGSGANKDEVLAALHTGFDSITTKLDQRSGGSTAPPEEFMASVKEEFEHIRGTLAANLVRPAGATDKDDIVDGVREQLDALRNSLTSDQNEVSKETLGAIRQEVESLRETFGSALVPSGSTEDREEILNILKNGLNDIRANVNRSEGNGISEESLNIMRAEFEMIRQSIATTLAHHDTRGDTEEVLDAVRIGLDDLRSHLEKKMDNPERQMSATGEILDALNDGLDSLRSDVSKMVEKPVDTSTSLEILETLREGIAAVRSDIEKLKEERAQLPSAPVVVEETEEDVTTGKEIVLADDPDAQQTREEPISTEVAAPTDVAPTTELATSTEVADLLRRDDLERMEGMLAQLQIKMDTMGAHILEPHSETTRSDPEDETATAAAPAPAPVDATIKEDIMGIEQLLKDLQDSVNVLIVADKPEAAEGVARKEDTDAIETLLRNTKAQLDEMALPDSSAIATKESIESLEVLAKSIADSVEAFSAKVDENVASKGDVAVVEVLAGDIKTLVEEMKEASKPSEESEPERITKADLDVLGVLCTDIKTKMDQFPEADVMPSKADVEQMIGLIHDFRDSHDKLKDSYETDIAVTAKAFDDRKKEADDIVVSIADMKTLLEEAREELKGKIQEEGQSVQGLIDNIKGLEDTIGANFSISADVKELMEIVNREFERAQGSIEGLKSEQDQKAASALEKHDEVKSAIVTDLSQKIDERFDAMISRYDDAQLLVDAQTKAMEERATKQEDILTDAKTMSEELKLTVDTLGTTITELGSTFTETSEKIAEISEKVSSDSQTVFDRIEDMSTKLTDNHTEIKEDHQTTREKIVEALTAINSLQGDAKEEHQMTREQITGTLDAINNLKGEVIDSNPKFMVTLGEILTLVTQHYEHSQKAQEATHEHVRAIAEESKAQVIEMKNGFAALPALLPPPPPPAIEDGVNSDIQEKLNKLISHADDSEKATAQLARLEEIQKQVMTTAAQINDFVAKQTVLITEGHETKEREAEEMALLLERRTAQKEQIEADIHNLNHEKDSLRAEVEALQSERDALAAQKSRLAADVSSLQTALDIRREELQIMDAKADAIERRILEGIMDHSRALLMSKTAKNPGKTRSKRNASNATQSTLASLPGQNPATTGISLALKPRPAIRRNPAQANSGSRRILSLSQITANVPTGAQAYTTTAPMASNATTNLKRSQSVKTNYVRKTSWGKAGKSFGELNKENETLGEESEDDEDHAHDHDHDQDLISDNGTERRHSYATTSAYTESYADGTIPETDGRRSFGVGDSELTYGTGSYLTGSDIDRRTSYGSNFKSTQGAGTIIDEESESEEESEEESGSEHDEDEQSHVEHTDVVKSIEPAEQIGDDENAMVIYTAPSDSGLGSELASTVGVNAGDKNYFRRAAEEESQVGVA